MVLWPRVIVFDLLDDDDDAAAAAALFSLHGDELLADVADVADAIDVIDVTDPLSEFTSEQEPSFARGQCPALPHSGDAVDDVTTGAAADPESVFLQRPRGRFSGVFSISTKVKTLIQLIIIINNNSSIIITIIFNIFCKISKVS